LQGARAEHGHVVREEADAPSERRPEEPRVPGRGEEVDEREEGDDAQVASQVGVEAGLGGGAAAGPAERLLLGRERLLVLAAARPAPGLAGEAARLVLGVPREVAGTPLGLPLEPLGPLAVPVVVPGRAASRGREAGAGWCAARRARPRTVPRGRRDARR